MQAREGRLDIAGWLKGEVAIADKIDKAKEVYIPIIVVGVITRDKHFKEIESISFKSW